MTEVQAEKAALRRGILELRRALSPDRIQQASRQACQRLAGLPEWRKARVVALYAGTRGELDPRAAADGSRHFVFPYVDRRRRVLDFRRVAAADELVAGAYGVDAPDPGRHPRVPIEEIDLFVVPGVAFDARGRRLGLGKGYYDATLGHARPDAVVVGFAWNFQCVPEVPVEAHDRPVDVLVTPTTVLRFRREPAT